MTVDTLFPQVLVVGGGLAGLSATIEAYRAGANVTLLEKEASVGGNSAKATSGMNAIGTPAQLARNVSDSVDLFMQDTLTSGGGLSDALLARTLTANAHEAHAFLESFGIELNVVSQCGGHSKPRTHREGPRADGKPAPVGWDIIKALKAYIEKIIEEGKTSTSNTKGTVKIIPKAQVQELILEGDRVVGLRYLTDSLVQELRGDSVVLATGGFSAGEELLKEFKPEYLSLATTNGPWAKGDGVKLARHIGAELIDMSEVQLHPTGFIDPKDINAKTKFLAPEALRGHGGILFSQQTGRRFTNELGTRAAVTHDICTKSAAPASNGLPSGAFLVLNEAAVQLFDPTVIGFYVGRGFFKKVQGIEGVLETFQTGFCGMQVPHVTKEELLQDLTRYNAAAESKEPDTFGKKVFPVPILPSDTFYICGITPAIHYTMGGVQINAAAQVMKAQTDPLSIGPSGVPISGLFAAGEVTGGLHGKNRLAGNSLLECVVFGRIAGQRSAAVKRHLIEPALSSESFTPLLLQTWTALGNCVRLYRFQLPGPLHQTGLKVGEYIAVRAEINGKELIRYYSPISRPDDPGHIDLLLKVDEGGAMSQYIAALRPGMDVLEFKGPIQCNFPDLAIDRPLDGKVKHIALIAGGTGIAAMIQIIRTVFHFKRADLHVKLLYGAMDETELVYRDVLLQKALLHPNFQVYLTVDKPTDTWPQGPQYGTGYLTAEKLKQELPPPGDDVRIIICGPWKMCQVLKKTLPEIGYPEKLWFSYM